MEDIGGTKQQVSQKEKVQIAHMISPVVGISNGPLKTDYFSPLTSMRLRHPTVARYLKRQVVTEVL